MSRAMLLGAQGHELMDERAATFAVLMVVQQEMVDLQCQTTSPGLHATSSTILPPSILA